LRTCWRIIQPIQLHEYTKLGLSTTALVQGAQCSRKELSEGPTTQALAAGFSKPTIHPSTEMSEELAPEESNRSFRRSSRKRSRNGKRYGKVCYKVEQNAQGVPDAQSDRRGPPTDRPPDKPAPWKGAVRGSSYERASSRHVSQLASSCGNNGLSGKASPLEKIQLRVKTPSNQRHASAAGSSQVSHPVGSCRHTSGRRSRASGYVCGSKESKRKS
jgi:hypothetical protein